MGSAGRAIDRAALPGGRELRHHRRPPAHGSQPGQTVSNRLEAAACGTESRGRIAGRRYALPNRHRQIPVARGQPEQNPNMWIELDATRCVRGGWARHPHCLRQVFHGFRKPVRRLARHHAIPARHRKLRRRNDDRLSRRRRFPVPPVMAGKRNDLQETGDCALPNGRLRAWQ